MSFKRGTRNADRGLDLRSEEASLVSRTGFILWNIYKGPASEGQARGFVPALWGADCIPASLFRLKTTQPTQFKRKIKNSVKFIRFHTPFARTFYTAEDWGVLAAPPEGRPTFGFPVRLSKGDPTRVGAVPEGQPGALLKEGYFVSRKERLDRLRSSRSSSGPLYPEAGVVWYGNLRVTPEGMAYYAEETKSPLLDVTRALLNINSKATRHAHRASQTYHEDTRVNPMSEIRASAADIPIQINIPYLPDLLAMMSIVAAMKEHFDSTSTRNRHSREHIVFDTEVIDYELLRRKQI